MADEQRNEADRDQPPEKARTKKIVRRVGRGVFLGGGFLLFVLMMVGVVRGIQQERAWNPYTGRPHQEGQCLERARDLMLDAGEQQALDPGWIGRYRRWVAGCKDGHGELHELLRETRSKFQKLPDDES